MKLLLDTHAFIWWDSAPDRLPSAVRDEIAAPANEVLLSVVSVWEMEIKWALGKLALATPLDRLIAEQQANGVHLLPIRLDHVLALSRLPPHHRDPFDRMLVAQAQVERAVLVTRDEQVRSYAVETRW